MSAYLTFSVHGQVQKMPCGSVFTVGRDYSSDLVLDDKVVSRNHAIIRQLGGGDYFVIDSGSSNGTYVNGSRVAEAKLEPGDRLTIGPVTFIVQIDGKPASIRPEDAAATHEEAEKAVMPVPTDSVDTDDILDLGDIDFELDDPTAAVDAMLDEEDEEDEDKV